jgi:hypothetical protein
MGGMLRVGISGESCGLQQATSSTDCYTVQRTILCLPHLWRQTAGAAM